MCHHCGRPRALLWTQPWVHQNPNTRAEFTKDFVQSDTNPNSAPPDALVMTYNPINGPISHIGFNTHFRRSALQLCPVLFGAQTLRNNMHIVVFLFLKKKHLPTPLQHQFIVPLFLISLSSLLPVTFYSSILTAQTPTPFDVTLCPPRIVP